MKVVTVLPVQMPKTGTTAVAAHLGVPHQHRRGIEVKAERGGEVRVEVRGECGGEVRSERVYTFGVLRRPLDWYRSWYAHVRRWSRAEDGSVGNVRCDRALEGLGSGSRSFTAVLYGLTHLDEMMRYGDRTCLPESDHLFAPGGLLPGFPTMYSAHLAWWFGSELEWVDELVPMEDLAGLGVERRNVGATVADDGLRIDVYGVGDVGGDPYQPRWLEYDERLYGEAWRLKVRGAGSPARRALRERVVSVAERESERGR